MSFSIDEAGAEVEDDADLDAVHVPARFRLDLRSFATGEIGGFEAVGLGRVGRDVPSGSARKTRLDDRESEPAKGFTSLALATTAGAAADLLTRWPNDLGKFGTWTVREQVVTP